MIVLSIVLALSILFCFGSAIDASVPGYFELHSSVFDLMFNEYGGEAKLITSFVFWLLALIITILITVYKSKVMDHNNKIVIGGTAFAGLLVFISSILSFACVGEAKETAGRGLIVYAIVHLLIFIGYGVMVYLQFKEIKELEAARRLAIMRKRQAQNQQNAVSQTPVTSNTVNVTTNTKIDNIELLKKYKELLDMGVITEDEFKKKKEELL